MNPKEYFIEHVCELDAQAKRRTIESEGTTSLLDLEPILDRSDITKRIVVSLSRDELKARETILIQTFCDTYANTKSLKFFDGRIMLPTRIRKIVDKYNLFCLGIIRLHDEIRLSIFFDDLAIFDLDTLEPMLPNAGIVIEDIFDAHIYLPVFNYFLVDDDNLDMRCRVSDSNVVDWLGKDGIDLLATLLEYRMRCIAT